MIAMRSMHYKLSPSRVWSPWGSLGGMEYTNFVLGESILQSLHCGRRQNIESCTYKTGPLIVYILLTSLSARGEMRRLLAKYPNGIDDFKEPGDKELGKGWLNLHLIELEQVKLIAQGRYKCFQSQVSSCIFAMS